jgi:uncharacterized membrane protein YagU involved in acid resistance
MFLILIIILSFYALNRLFLGFYYFEFNMYYSSKYVIIWVEILHIWFSILFGLCFLDVVAPQILSN